VEPTPALADRQQFDQVLGNLFLNARDASPLAHGAPAIRIDVRDTGIGMDDATRQQIFEPFFTTKGVGKGTGLGLAVVLGAIQQDHGMIEAHSALGRGTTFSVFWPLAEAVRQRCPGLPVLFVSGYTDDIIALHGFVREGVALLEKPFSPSVLARKVRGIVDARSARGA